MPMLLEVVLFSYSITMSLSQKGHDNANEERNKDYLGNTQTVSRKLWQKLTQKYFSHVYDGQLVERNIKI